ncbi:Autophagy-related protein 18a [Fagus crenata]
MPLDLSSSLQPTLFHLSFNQDHSCFAAGTDHGFQIFNCDTARSSIATSSPRCFGVEGVRVQLRRPHAPPPDQDHHESYGTLCDFAVDQLASPRLSMFAEGSGSISTPPHPQAIP